MAITEDASTPAVVQVTGTAGACTTASFSPPTNTLLVALVGGGWGNTSTTTASITDTAGGTWTTAATATGTNGTTFGVAKIFYRYLSSAPGSITVSATFTGLSGGRELAVRVLNGAASSQAGAGTGTTVNTTATTAGTVSVTTTVTGSQVYGISDDAGLNDAYTANGATSILSDFNDTTDQVRLVAWKATSTTGTPGATTLGGTWAGTTRSNIAAFEVLPVTSTTFTGSANLAAVGSLTDNATVVPGAPNVTLAGVATLVATPLTPVIPQFPTIPRDLTVELFLNNTWIDVTSDVRAAAGIDITRGRPNEAPAAQPSTCAMTFDNRSGNYSPRNPMGVYFGQIGRNTPIRVAVGLVRDTFSRTVANSWGTADTGQVWTATNSGTLVPSAFQVTGSTATHSVPSATTYRYCTIGTPGWRDVDVAVTFTLPFTTVTGASVFPGSVILRWFSAAVGFYMVQPRIDTNGHVMLGLVYGDGSIVASFVDTGIIHSSGQALRVRAQIEGQTIRGKVWPASGNEPYRWQVIANDVYHPYTGSVGIFSSTQTGNTNTYPMVFTYDNIVVRSPRFFGEIASWPQRWDVTGTDVTAPIEAAGVTRRLGQGQSPLSSTLYQAETTQLPAPKAYWPCEDGPDSAFIASGIGGPAMTVRGSGITKFASYSGFVASQSIPVIGTGSTWVGPITPYTATNSATISFIGNVASGATTVDRSTIMAVNTADGLEWYILYRINPGPPVVGGYLSVEVWNNAGQVYDSGALSFGIDGHDLMFKLSLTQNGTGVDYNIATAAPSDPVGQFVAHTVPSTTFTRVIQIRTASNLTLNNFAIGHIAVVDYVDTIFHLTIPLSGYAGEPALVRIDRLCSQLGVVLSYFGDLNGGAYTQRVGAQHVDTLLSLITECANADLGTLTEPRGDTGLLYRTGASVYSPTVTAVLDYGGRQIAPPFEPVDDDQLTRNEITVTRRDGTSATATQLTGRMSILDPSAGGVGIYDTSVTVNVAYDSQLPDFAGWLLNLGTVDQARYPLVRVDLASPQVVSDPVLSAAILDLGEGDFFQIINPKIGQTPDTINQICRGYHEHISTFEHSIAINASPEVPYDITRLDRTGVKFDTTGSTVASNATATQTTLSVATPSGTLWSTVAGAMPIQIAVGGERMSVTGVSGTTSPQTFTVVRSANGVVKPQTAGTAVQLFFPSRIAL